MIKMQVTQTKIDEILWLVLCDSVFCKYSLPLLENDPNWKGTGYLRTEKQDRYIQSRLNCWTVVLHESELHIKLLELTVSNSRIGAKFISKLQITHIWITTLNIEHSD